MPHQRPKKDKPNHNAPTPAPLPVDDYGYPIPAGTTPAQLAQINLMRKQNAEFAQWMSEKGYPATEDGHWKEFRDSRPDLFPTDGNGFGPQG